MVTVNFKKICGCVIKNELNREFRFSNKELALKFSNKAIKILEQRSCHAHKFYIKNSSKNSQNIVIDSEIDMS